MSYHHPNSVLFCCLVFCLVTRCVKTVHTLTFFNRCRKQRKMFFSFVWHFCPQGADLFLKAERAHICMQIKNKIRHFLCIRKHSSISCVNLHSRVFRWRCEACDVRCQPRYETWRRAREWRRLWPIVMEASGDWSDGWWRGVESSQRKKKEKKRKKRGVGRDTGHTLLHLLITLPVWLSAPAIEAKTASVVRFLGMDRLKLRLSFAFRAPMGQLKLNVSSSFGPADNFV